tara:strand:+ start:826 stop:1452 length:627 start_codon:yes stop_codon:yes gene_type:complete
MSIDKGMFNFQGVMNKFYGYQPGKDDSEGRAIKNSFMANMVQSGFDAQMAKDMAQQQSQIAQSNMTLAADLEARNTSSNMKQEFNYGMQSMGAQYEYQNKFANNQYNRDLGTLAAQGEQSRQNIGASGAQDRLTSVTQGEQQRLGIQETGKEQRASDTNRITTEGEEQRKGYETQGEQSRLTMQEADKLEAGKENRQAARSRSMARAF